MRRPGHCEVGRPAPVRARRRLVHGAAACAVACAAGALAWVVLREAGDAHPARWRPGPPVGGPAQATGPTGALHADPAAPEQPLARPGGDPIGARVPAAAPPAPAESAPARVLVAPRVDAGAEDRARLLRELERRDPRQAAAEALLLVGDPERAVHLNALAVLARSDAPEAAAALGRLGPDDRRLAAALRARRGT